MVTLVSLVPWPRAPRGAQTTPGGSGVRGRDQRGKVLEVLAWRKQNDDDDDADHGSWIMDDDG